MNLNRLYIILLGAALAVGCSREISLEFRQDNDGVWRVSQEQMDAWAKMVFKADSASAKALIDRAYSAADSLAAGEEPPHTLETFARDVADRFLSLSSPFYNEQVYEMALDRESECDSWDSWGRRGSNWRRALLNLNRAGTMVSDFWLSSAGESPDTLLRKLLPGAPETVLFIYGESCHACDILIDEICRSRTFKRMAESGKVQFVSLYTGENDNEFVQKASLLPAYWRNWRDRENVVMYDRAFDTRMIPSLYVIDQNGIVLLRGARTTKTCLSFLKKL